MSKRRKALELVARSAATILGVPYSLSFPDPAVEKALLQPEDPTRDPGLRKYHKATDRYRRQLQSAFRDWRRENRDLNLLDDFAVQRAGLSLRDRLNDVAVTNLPDAYRTGSGKKNLETGAVLTVAQAVQSNNDYLTSSFVPYVIGDLEDPEDDDEGGAVFVTVDSERSEAWESRLDLYSGLFWALIWMGFGDEAADKPVRRLLDPRADHCATCPPKARDYDDFAQMVAETGGVPGDGSDQCVSNCRCSIEVLGDGGWSSTV